MKKINQKLRFILLGVIFCMPAFVYAKNKVALVVGNSNYESSKLRNPINDAMDVAAALKKLGFKVHLVLDANQEEFETAVNVFSRRSVNTVSFFYYAGHAVQYNGVNYLIPIGVINNIRQPNQLRYRAVDLNYIVDSVSNNVFNMIILDACRDNPFRGFSRSISRGLARIRSAEGTLIAFSTSPGKVALDGNGRNSPYTKHLVDLMSNSYQPIELILKEIRRRVKKETNGKQNPWYEASIDGDFYFNNYSGANKNNIEENSRQTIESPEYSPREALRGTSGTAISITNCHGHEMMEFGTIVRHCHPSSLESHAHHYGGG